MFLNIHSIIFDHTPCDTLRHRWYMVVTAGLNGIEQFLQGSRPDQTHLPERLCEASSAICQWYSTYGVENGPGPPLAQI